MLVDTVIKHSAAFLYVTIPRFSSMLSEVFFKLFPKQTAKLDGSIMAYLRRVIVLVSDPLFFARSFSSSLLPLLFAAPVLAHVARVRPSGRRIHGILHSRLSLFAS